jgi:hypothetical protein
MAPTIEDGSGLCPACNMEWGKKDTVQCDDCEKWFHFTCVGADSSTADEEWKCHPCGGKMYPLMRTPLDTKPPETVEQSTSGQFQKGLIPTIPELMQIVKEQQEREIALRVDFQRQQQDLSAKFEKLSQEYDAVKRLLDTAPPPAPLPLETNASALVEDYQVILNREEIFNVQRK